jgi:hypothetical protein
LMLTICLAGWISCLIRIMDLLTESRHARGCHSNMIDIWNSGATDSVRKDLNAHALPWNNVDCNKHICDCGT